MYVTHHWDLPQRETIGVCMPSAAAAMLPHVSLVLWYSSNMDQLTCIRSRQLQPGGIYRSPSYTTCPSPRPSPSLVVGICDGRKSGRDDGLIDRLVRIPRTISRRPSFGTFKLPPPPAPCLLLGTDAGMVPPTSNQDRIPSIHHFTGNIPAAITHGLPHSTLPCLLASTAAKNQSAEAPLEKEEGKKGRKRRLHSVISPLPTQDARGIPAV